MRAWLAALAFAAATAWAADSPARRIVTLAPFLTELAFSAGLGERVVGVSAYSDFPPAARALPQVSSSAGFDIEKIAALEPDLVFVWSDSVRREDIARIERFGAHVVAVSARSLEDVPRALETVGRFAGADVTAQARAFRDRIEALRAKYSRRRTLSVFLEVSHNPLMTVAGAHYMNDALEVCGARNAFIDLPGVAPVVPWEEVYRRDPQVVVGTGDRARLEANWRARPTLSAVKEGHVVQVDADIFVRPTLRLADGTSQLCEKLDRLRR